MELKEAIEVLKRHNDNKRGHPVEIPDIRVLVEAIDTVVSELERQELHKEMLSKISTKEYGEDGIGLSKEDLDECLYK